MIKKILVTLLILGFTSPAFAINDFIPSPSWEEFCPIKYQQATYVDNKYGALKYTRDFLLICSLVGLPFGMSNVRNYYEREDRNYWASRKLAFGKGLSSCNQYLDDTKKESCYNYIRANEEAKSKDFVSAVEKWSDRMSYSDRRK